MTIIEKILLELSAKKEVEEQKREMKEDYSK